MASIDRLEIGGNVFEIIEFSLERTGADGETIKGTYGVNVAKVREVVRLPKINSLASKIPAVAGLFELRGIPIPAINLSHYLGDKKRELDPSMQIIVTEFSGKRAGFIVNSTQRIRRINWEDVLPVSTEKGASLNGMTLIENNEFLFIVDLERIIATIEQSMNGEESGSPYQYMMGSSRVSENSSLFTKNTQNSHALNSEMSQQGVNSHGPMLLVVDDSKFILNGIAGVLTRMGYRVITADDGFEAKLKLEEMISGESQDPPIDLVVTDVEMPKMDGLSLTKWIKEHPSLTEMPVVIHSSLSSAANQQAGMTLGVQGYVVKNDIKRLDSLIKEILGTTYVPGSHFKNVS